MEQNSAVEHDTTLEHALDIARKNVKEAQRLLDDALAKRRTGDVDDDRVNQLKTLLDVAAEDLRRVTREQ
ncbi:MULTISPECIES: hypothetical protein [Arthrobacter]|uniref:Uncharacterized protein n=1 Tax=Arthrobacter oryzae TaxID=409290 RepID=A0A3N0BX25_9MICC|nr:MULTISPECIES: hypothetical protein [Arthrobacter]QYF89960.1 hypothetical protein KY499_00700 [Arthrobacter sp. PAMC25284]RNL53818.1 hypothetical protein D7003_11830 [Arthrobacter oryzae]